MERIQEIKLEILELKKTLLEKEIELFKLVEIPRNPSRLQDEGLTNEDIARFSRQIIMPEVGMKGQRALKKSSVLIVGAGGLGCPSALYLAGAGIGCLGIVDYDEVEVNNLHRQLLHSEASIGITKVHSAAISLNNLNSSLKVIPYHLQLDSTNAMDIIGNYDVVLDATDNVATRYLLSDACVLSNRPLVSGSALKLEGQLTVYNYNQGPCYRCLFPTPPPPETVTNCGDGGVLGVVPGVIGTLQALEAIKIILNLSGVLGGKLLIFDGADSTFRSVQLRKKSPDCAACGVNSTITSLVDYEQFCGAKANDKSSSVHLLTPEERMSVTELQSFISQRKAHMLIDVRSPMEFQICSLPRSINFSMEMLNKEAGVQIIKNRVSQEQGEEGVLPVFVVCRRGNDSQKAVVKLKEALDGCSVEIKDIVGGLHAWTREVDSKFPIY